MSNLAGLIMPIRQKNRVIVLHFKNEFLIKAHESLIIHYTVTDSGSGPVSALEIQHFKDDATIAVHRVPIIEEG